MMAPAVSASCGRTFLQKKKKHESLKNTRLTHVKIHTANKHRWSKFHKISVFLHVSHFGPKHMQRLARYPLEKAKTVMKTMNQPSWWKKTGRLTRGWTLHNMKRGTKTRRHTIIAGSNRLSFCGWNAQKYSPNLVSRVPTESRTSGSLKFTHLYGGMCDSRLTHIQMAVKLRPPQSHRLNSRKQLTGMKYFSEEESCEDKMRWHQILSAEVYFLLLSLQENLMSSNLHGQL